MQHITADDPNATVLLRIERNAGHGVGKPLDKQVEDLADQYSFFAWQLGPLAEASAMLGRS
jgi:prolyl oligopeptidase